MNLGDRTGIDLADSVPTSPANAVAIVGGGPRCLGILDRLCANASELIAPGRKVTVHIFDPYPVGGGRVWRRDQPPLLWMNVPAADVALFTDQTCEIEGPITPGPTLAEWIEDHRDELAADPDLADEVADLQPGSFASRGLQSAYLTWIFDNLVASAPPTLEFVVHRAQVIDIVDELQGPELKQRVLTDDRTSVLVDRVVLAQGHLDDDLSAGEEALQKFAADHDLVYLPPAYTADCDATRVPGGEPVLVSGLGLAFIDWMVLLGEARGGRFTDAEGRLTYVPSGAEPIMYVGSRRGVPYRPKITHPLLGPAAQLPMFFSVDAVSQQFPDPAGADFRQDLWPLACKDILYAHYHELFHAHVERTTMPWLEFLSRFAVPEFGSAEMTALIQAAVPDEKDRLVIDDLDQPLREKNLSEEAMHVEVRELTASTLERITDPRCSVDAAVVLALFSVYGVFGDLARRRLLAPRVMVADVDGWLHGLFSHLTSGPPPERLAQLIAMADAGVVRFLGDGFTVSADAGSGRFVARSTARPAPVHSHCLIEARLPPADINRTVDSLVRTLSLRGELSDDIAGVKGGRIQVDSDGRLLNSVGAPHPSRWAVGPWISGAGWAHAFPRPGRNAGFFRQNDALARLLIS